MRHTFTRPVKRLLHRGRHIIMDPCSVPVKGTFGDNLAISDYCYRMNLVGQQSEDRFICGTYQFVPSPSYLLNSVYRLLINLKVQRTKFNTDSRAPPAIVM